MRLDARHWATTDGHHHTSIPVTVPAAWRIARNDLGDRVYLAGVYSIVRRRYGQTGWTYDVFRDGVKLTLAFYSRLTDAKARAVKNAEGRDVVSVA